MKFKDLLKKIKARGFKGTINACFRKFLPNAKYLLMKYNGVSEPKETHKEIFVRDMLIGDVDFLSNDYFSLSDHEYKRYVFREKILNEKGYIFLDRFNNLIGYCWIKFNGSVDNMFKIKKCDAYLSEFYIDKRYRHHGYSTLALNSVIAMLRDSGKLVITLAVRPENTYALKCYNRVGFIAYRKVCFYNRGKILFPHYSL